MQQGLLKGFYLHDFRIEPTGGRVVGPNGEAHLKPKAVEVLLYLAQRPFEVVERADIIAAVWGDGKGSSEALSHAISDLRSGLDDHADDPRLIQTVPRRGYRLLEKPRFSDESAEPDEMYAEIAEGSFLGKLMRRGVVQAGLAYLVFGWLLIQVADIVTPILGLAPWFPSAVTYAAIGGFPIVLVLAWMLEQSDGRWFLDRGAQSGRMLSGLERNYLSILVAYGIAAIGATFYQAVWGFKVPAPAETIVAEAEALLPVQPNSIAVLKFVDISNSDEARAFSDGLGEDILDRLARVPGLAVSSRTDSWSLPENATSNVVRRRLRVAYFLEGSVRLVDDDLKVVVQMIESENGFHVFSRTFEAPLEEYAEVQQQITELTVANLRAALPDDADTRLITADDATSPDVYLLYRQGKAIIDQKKTSEELDEAIRYFQRALELDPAYSPAFAGICIAEVKRFEFTREPSAIQSAEGACGSALASNPNLGVVYSAIGRLRAISGTDLEAAESAYLRALELNPRDVESMRGLAYLAEIDGRVDEAESLLRQAIDMQPGNWVTIDALGTLYFVDGRYEDAAHAYRQVTFLDPENWLSLGNLGSALMMTGDFDSAIDPLSRSLNIERDAYFLSNLGIVYFYLGEYDKAAEIHREALEEMPRSVSTWLNLGDALRFSADPQSANAAYEKAKELAATEATIAPNAADNLYRRAWAEAAIGNLDVAKDYIDRSLDIDPDSPYAHYFDGLIEHERDNLVAALAALRRAVQQGYPPKMLARDPLLLDLHDDRAFRALVGDYEA
jgi:tetratricopeptide (TPR) repeat protein/DNA-binding winged helix-turn-helix (wHTH) protein